MNTTWVVAKKEILDARKNKLFIIILAMLLLLTLVSKQIATPILQNSVSITVTMSPGVNVSDSIKRIPPFISISNKWSFLCFPIICPSLLKEKLVLKTLPLSSSGMDPPIK